jgi:hypothetical protein
MLIPTGTTKKELLSIHRKVLTALSKVDLVNIHANINFSLKPNNDDCGASITVFRHDGHNATFNFYSFTSPKQNNENLKLVIDAIKLDNFEELQHLHFNH